MLVAKLQSLMDRFSKLTASDGAEKHSENQTDDDPHKQTLTAISEMDGTVQEIEGLCNEHGDEMSKAQTAKDILKALRLAYEEPNSTEYCNLLPLIEELKEMIASFENVAKTQSLVPPEDGETAS